MKSLKTKTAVKKITTVKEWWRKWNNRLMHADDMMSRASRTNLYEEVVEMVSIRDRTISMLLTADPESSHYADMVKDAKALIGEE